MRCVFVGLLIVFFIFPIQISAFAEERINSEEWDPSSIGPVTTWTAPLNQKGELAVQSFFFYTNIRGTFDSDGEYGALPEGESQLQFQQQLMFLYGITDRLEIDAQTVYQENYTKQEDVKAHSEGFGDSYLYARYCLHEEQGWMPHMTGLLQLMMPTGKYQHADPDKLSTDLIGAGSWDPGIGLILTKKLKPFILHADAILSFPQKVKIDGVKTEYANYLNYDLGFEYFLPKGFNLMLELNGLLQGDRKEDGDKVAASDIRTVTLSPGIGWSNDTIQTLFAYQRTMSGVGANANDTLVFTFIYTF